MIRKNISLKKYNSFNIEVNAKEFAEINSKQELIEIANKTKGKKVLYLGGGSNILFTKDFDGIVIHLNIKGITCEKTNSDETVVQANAGENWNNFVEFCIKKKFRRNRKFIYDTWKCWFCTCSKYWSLRSRTQRCFFNV